MDFDLRVSSLRAALLNSSKSCFYGCMLTRMTVNLDKSIKTAATNCAGSIWFNPDYADALNDAEFLGVMLHEIYHTIFKHGLRKGSRDHRLWNIAGDYVINAEIISIGYVLPGNVLHDPKYLGWTTDAVYNELAQNPNAESMQPDHDDVKPDKNNDEDTEESTSSNTAGKDTEEDAGSDYIPSTATESDIDVLIRGAVMDTQMRGHSTLPTLSIERLVQELDDPVLDWLTILKIFARQLFPNDYSFRRPSRRSSALGMYLPSISNGVKADNVLFAIDVSGSISITDFKKFISEVYGVFTELNPNKIGVMQFDDKITSIDHLSSVNEFEQIKFKGGGGTIINPVIIESNKHDYAGLVVITDGWFMPTSIQSKVPVIWLVYDNPTFQAPYGEVVHFSKHDI